MQNKVAIITGAGRGIGRAIALELSSRGFRLSLASRTQADLESVAKETESSLPIKTDITNPTEVNNLVQKTLSSFGRIDAIINNAGLAPLASIEQTTIDQWHAVLNTNLSSGFYLAKAVWPTFKQQRGGCIVNISSFSSRDPLPGFVAYGPAKAG